MSDYTPLGIEKLAQQAATDPSTIRCPRDGVVMRVLQCRAERTERGEVAHRELPSVPAGREWRLTQIDVECPACRRRALGVEVAERVADPSGAGATPPRKRPPSYGERRSGAGLSSEP